MGASPIQRLGTASVLLLVAGVHGINVYGQAKITASPTPLCTRHAFDTSTTQAPAEAERAARQGLKRFINAIPPNELRQFNFSSVDESQEAILGAMAFRVFVLRPDNILHCASDAPITDLTEPLPMWFFPVTSGTEYRTILRVELIDDRWAATGIGDSDLAKSFAALLVAWPPSTGHEYLFVRNYQTLSEFIILRRAGSMKIYPFPSAAFSWGLREVKLLDPPDALTFLRQGLARQGIH